ncbi:MULTISPECIES: elongation factor G [unclassified Peribacillus]|uniref:elongation factor G n=1 Tax=unclassified Peribacillus TaxID=2675266 RepID=UPI001F4D7F10|nr:MULTISPECIES: TetM/TetW/TetO/TetS family tetracycline resistance ribosomal protection protein [unclassified Peribacillus]MCK1985991.1 TetM/TetW/TetO/TetS family tetracycline resistance ribosomal protection protein [Peribacillus sp. Aquil_B1]MCK2011214.1 TetM/TetW/TetO/TetS family tetracycline resistance ribosomal protection protein [Peribacillus sp. Aquil_B8]
MSIINIGILAHVDAGKTSLTEYLLYETGIKKELGYVDKGNTSTDSHELEKARGITIKSTPISFHYKNIKINIIDTPGHSDFISEVERSLSVLDCAILVISAVEGIQAQTKFIFNELTKLNIPTFIFINKVDRSGADYEKVLYDFKVLTEKRLLKLCTIQNEGKKNCSVSFEMNKTNILDILSLENDRIVEMFINNKINDSEIQNDLIRQIRAGLTHPVFLGSAIQGKGVTDLLKFIVMFASHNNCINEDKLCALVFKVEISDTGSKKCFFRVFSGTIKVRDSINIINKYNDENSIKVKKLCKLDSGKIIQSQFIQTGDIGVIYDSIPQIGDVLGYKSELIKHLKYTSPNIETSIIPVNEKDIFKLYNALLQISEEDPLVQITKDEISNNINVRFFGEVQKEVIKAILQQKYNLSVKFSETSVIYIEKPLSKGFALYEIGDSNNPFCATVGITVEPNNTGSGLEYVVNSEWGALPHAFYKAIEETVRNTLKQGIYGWEIDGIRVTITHAAYKSPISTASDFRNLTPLVLMEAIKISGVRVFEPINVFNLHIPSRFLKKSISNLLQSGAEVNNQITKEDTCFISGFIKVTEIDLFRHKLKDWTEGEGIFITEPHSFRVLAPNVYPRKKFVRISPLNREEYLLSIFKGLKK